MISLTNITLQRGRDNLLEDTSLTLFEGHKAALIGRNGCGKSSFFALLLGEITTETGELTMPSGSRIAHMAQEVEHSERPALDYVLDGHKELRQIQAEIRRAEDAQDNLKLAALYEKMDDVDGYSANHQAAELLHGLGFRDDQLSSPVKSFSGGWQIRLNLAQALMMPSDIMLLDEPTNHLDLDTTYWLEQRLRRYQGTLILISHDRDFIDNVADEIVHIEHKKLNLYKGNYSDFERQRAERLSLQQANYEKQQREIKHLQSFITRFKAKASKAKQAQSRVKQLDRMELVASAQVDSPFTFRFFDNSKQSTPLISLRDVQLGYADHCVLQNINLSLNPGDRLGLLGVNGAGKSTLIKSLTGDLSPQRGTITRGDNCEIGYFAQHQLEALDMEASALLHIQRITPSETEQKIRNFLGGFDFLGDKALEPIAPFSGGEKARLALALIVWQKPNLLLLDEPTNHLDLDMRSALTLALQEFSGALVVVSHDRHLLRNSVDQYLLANQGVVSDFDGTLDDYHKWIANQQRDGAAPAKSQQQAKPVAPTPVAKRQLSQAERKARNSLQTRLKRIEQKLDSANQSLQQLETQLSNADLYDETHKDQLTDLLHQQHQLNQEVETLEENWMAHTEELEQYE